MDTRSEHQSPTDGPQFYSTVLPSRNRRNLLKTNDGAPFYPSQKPEGVIPTVRLDNAETGHIRYSFALWLQERTAPVRFSDHASEIP